MVTPGCHRLSSRREALGLGAAFVLAACSRSSATKAPPTWPRTSVHAGVEMIELFPQGADEGAPLVVAIHGMGDRPDRWVDTWRTFPARVQIVLPRAFDPWSDGYSWFQFKDGMTDEQFGAAVGAAEARLWPAIAEVAGGRRPIVTGFSQGGILSFAMAARHADAIKQAFPVSGSCPGPLLPKEHARAAPLVAFHGTEDRVLDIKWGREAVHAFQEQGNTAMIREYPGIGHAMSAEMRRDLWNAIQQALA